MHVEAQTAHAGFGEAGRQAAGAGMLVLYCPFAAIAIYLASSVAAGVVDE